MACSDHCCIKITPFMTALGQSAAVWLQCLRENKQGFQTEWRRLISRPLRSALTEAMLDQKKHHAAPTPLHVDGM